MPSEHAGESPKLILVVTVDSLRWDMLGAYGDQTGVSPAFDRLAERSHVFEHAFATSSWTKPSISSLLTGSIVSRHLVFLSTLLEERATEYLRPRADDHLQEMYIRGNVLSERIPLFHEFLTGYRKAAFVDNVHLQAELGFDRGWDLFKHYRARKNEEGVPGNAEEINQDVLEFLKSHAQEDVLVWVHYFDVHWPYGPIAPYGQQFVGDAMSTLPEPYSHEALDELVQRIDDPRGTWATQILPGIYRAGIRIFDDRLGALFGELEAMGYFDPALIVITSDHGDEFFEHGDFGHGNNLYDTTVRIPLIIKLPGQSSAHRHAAPVSLVDVGPTILDICDRPHDGFFPDASSLQAVMQGASEPDRTAIFELVNAELENMKGIVDGRHKVLVEINEDGVDGRIFKLGDDDLPLDPDANARHMDELRAKLHAKVGNWDPRVLLFDAVARGDGGPETIERLDEIIEQLEALGYVQASGTKRGVPSNR